MNTKRMLRAHPDDSSDDEAEKDASKAEFIPGTRVRLNPSTSASGEAETLGMAACRIYPCNTSLCDLALFW